MYKKYSYLLLGTNDQVTTINVHFSTIIKLLGTLNKGGRHTVD